ncbi:MAG: GDP-mannose 4,6-dehydratase [Candidatus Jacksonbacteria bacterium]|nr:GDP-mannose 4,6-dehydratase [Candidatus Jacksonbacteria bacterium]
MKNILITGGSGFIGSHLSETLLSHQDTNVIVLDNFVTSDFYNIESFTRNPRFEFIKHDLTEPIDIERFPELAKFKLKIYGIEEIYHLACPTSPKDYDRLPLETCLANSHATKNALEIAKRYRSSFLFVSSSAVYGNLPTSDQPVKETSAGVMETLGARSCYSDGKRFAENLVVYFAAEYNFQAKIARLFNTYGPRMRLNDGRIIPDFVHQALQKAPLVIYGDESAASTFCYITDIVDGLIKLIASDASAPVNLGSEQIYRLKDVAEAIAKITGSALKIRYEEPIPYRTPELVPDITLAKEKLGWVPITPIEEGLVKTVHAMKASAIIKFKP